MELISLHAAPAASRRTAAAAGGLPPDWTEQTIGQFCSVKTGPFGTLLKASEYSETDGVPVISVGEVREGYFRLTDHTPLVPEKVQKRLPQYLLKAGDVVFGRKGAVERSALVRQPQAGWFLGSDGIAVRPSTEHCPEYVAAQFQSFRVRRWLASNSTGTTMASMNQGVLSRVAISFPPTIEEERSIAQVLNDADALIDSLEQLLTKKRQIKQGAMQELLTGERQLPGFGGEYKRLHLRALLSQPATYGIVTAGAFVQHGVRMLRGGDISDGKIQTDLPMVTHAKADEYSRTTLRRGDVVIALVGYPGEAALIPDELVGANISRAVGLLRPNYEIDGSFLTQLLNSSEGRRMVLAPSAGSAQLVVNLAALNKLELAVPQIREQQAIAQVLSDMDAEITALEARLTKARALKQAMAQALLTGRIRLPVAS